MPTVNENQVTVYNSLCNKNNFLRYVDRNVNFVHGMLMGMSLFFKQLLCRYSVFISPFSGVNTIKGPISTSRS